MPLFWKAMAPKLPTALSSGTQSITADEENTSTSVVPVPSVMLALPNVTVGVPSRLCPAAVAREAGGDRQAGNPG